MAPKPANIRMTKPKTLTSTSKTAYNHLKSLVAHPHLYLSSLYRLSRGTNLERWQAPDNLDPRWDARTSLLAEMIPDNVSVIEFGAARLILPRHLKSGCTYQPSDLIARSQDTIVLDLNKDLPKLPKFYDYAVFSGVLEYVVDIERMMGWLPSVASNVVFSYAVTDHLSDPATRMRNGWVNAMSAQEVEDLLRVNNMKCVGRARWQEQNVYKCVIQPTHKASELAE